MPVEGDPVPGGHGIFRDFCSCFDQSGPHPRARVGFHAERRDLTALGWRRRLESVEEAAAGRQEFEPLIEVSPEERRQVITLRITPTCGPGKKTAPGPSWTPCSAACGPGADR